MNQPPANRNSPAGEPVDGRGPVGGARSSEGGTLEAANQTPPSGSHESVVPPPAPPRPSNATPPPPPIRSTLPPVRQPTECGESPGVPSGIGSVSGVRWRGELKSLDETVRSSKTKRQSGESVETEDANEAAEAEEETTIAEQAAREAPPWLVSMVLHLILLIVLALLSTPVGSGVGNLILNIGRGDSSEVSELAEFSIASEEVLTDSESLVDAEAEVDLADIFDSADLETLEESTPLDIGAGVELVALRPMFQGRSGAMKQALLEIYGGTGETQDAVKLGLEWLKRNQLRSGGWSMRGPFTDGAISENESAATAMALLAFLGDGHTHKSGDYQEVVLKGMQYLIKLQDRGGFFAKAARSHEKLYAQAQATIAICELYGMTKDSWLRDRAQLAIDYAEQAQASLGGWRYEPGFDSDTSVTGWFVMALKSGRSAGLEVRDSTFEKVSQYLDSASSFDGAGYGYQANRDPTPAMTAEGLLCRQYLGWERDRLPLRNGIEALLLDAPFTISEKDVYYWYYATQVLHHYGSKPWEEWNNVMRVDLPKAQIKTGRESGSWPPQQDRWGQNSGRLFTTCLSIYCLEVYYRHTPLYQGGSTKDKK